MTTQFFASVRRNQRQWMVVLTILSIFAFLFDDFARGANNLSSNTGALFIAVLIAGAMSILGYPRGHGIMYGAIGFVVGGGAALVGSSFASNKPFVRTNVGNLSIQDLRHLQNQRIKLLRFVDSVAKKVGEFTPPDFMDTSERQMVGFEIFRKEARRLGVSVSDEVVNEYIKRITRDKLTTKDYVAALHDAMLSEAELFDSLRTELEVRLVNQLMQPPGKPYVFFDFSTRQGQRAYQASLTPDQLWDHFKKLHVHQQLTAVAVPITEFVRLVAEPTDSEIREFYDKYKNRPGDEYGNPGFLEQPKAKLAYLMASNLENYEKGLPNATEQEVADYYLKHMEEFRAGFEFPEGHEPPKGPASDAPADAASPENSDKSAEPKPETPVTPEIPKDEASPDKKDSEKKEPEKKAEPQKEAEKAEPAPSAESPKEDAKKDEEKKEESEQAESNCGVETTVAQADSQESAKPAEQEVKPDSKPESEQKPETASSNNAADQSAAPASEKPAAETPSEQPGPSPGAPPTGIELPPGPGGKPLAAPRYRELNDELKLQIREKILLEKAFEKMKAARDEAANFMDGLDLEYAAQQDQAKRTAVATGFVEKLKDYAAKNGLEFQETKPMTYQEMITSMDDRIGSATTGQGQRQHTVADEVFTRDAAGRGYQLALYTTRRAESPKAYYAFWKTEEIPERPRDLKDEATRQLVVDAWKFDKARDLAAKRTQDLVNLMKKGEADIPGALSGQTINGTPESPAVTVREAPKFTWLRSHNSFPQMGFTPPTTSMIEGIDQPGYNFMKTVFESISNNDVGFVLNEPRTVFYAVRVHHRETDPAEDGGVALQLLQKRFLNEKFTFQLPTPYDLLSVQLQNGIRSMWEQSFNTRYAIKFEDTSKMDSDM